MPEKENAGQDGKIPNHIVQAVELKGWHPIGKIEIDPQNTRADYLIILLNEVWPTLKPISYKEFNVNLFCLDNEDIALIEKTNPKLGIKKTPLYTFTTVIALMATITDVLCDKRLAAEVDDRGFITGWSWYKGPGYEG
jgi:hypothetical protein